MRKEINFNYTQVVSFKTYAAPGDKTTCNVDGKIFLKRGEDFAEKALEKTLHLLSLKHKTEYSVTSYNTFPEPKTIAEKYSACIIIARLIKGQNFRMPIVLKCKLYYSKNNLNI